MITINLLQPVGPSKEYEFELKDAIISPVVLDDLLGQIETDLNSFCDKIIADGGFVGRAEKMCVLCPGEPEQPHLKSKTLSGKYSLGPKLFGGGSLDKGYKNLDSLRSRYKQLFRVAKENFRKCGPDFPKIDIKVKLTFFRDTVTKEMDAFYPEET